MSGAVEGVALQDAVTTLDVWLAAYAAKPDTAIALPDHDDDLLTFGHLRAILAALTTPPARSYANGVPPAQFHAFAVALLGEVEKAGGDMMAALQIAAQAGVDTAAIRLLSQGDTA